MSISIIGTLKPKNNGTFPVAEAADIAVSEELRLPEALNAKAEQSDLEELSSELSEKASQSDLTTATTNIQGQIDQIVIASAEEYVVAPEVAQARVDADGISYSTLTDRLDVNEESTDKYISSIKENISDIAEQNTESITESDLTSENTYIATNGTITTSNNFNYSGAIAVEDWMKTVEINESSDISAGCAVAFYNSSELGSSTFISGVSLPDAVTPKTRIIVNIPATATYMAFSARKSNEFDVVIYGKSNIKIDGTLTSDVLPPSAKAVGNISTVVNQITASSEITISDEDLTKDYVILTDGTQTSNNNFHRSDMIPIESDMSSIVILSSGDLTGGCAVAFYSDTSFSTTDFISGVSLQKAVTSDNPVTVSIPAEALFVAFSARKSTPFSASINKEAHVKFDNTLTSPIYPPSAKAVGNVAAIVNQIAEEGYKEIDDSDLTRDYYIQPDGTLTSNSNFHVSDMIPYDSGMESITITKSGSLSGGCAVAFYTDSSFSTTSFISGVSLPEEVSGSPVIVTIPNNTAYLAFSARKSVEFNARIEYGIGVKVDDTFTSSILPPSAKAVGMRTVNFENSWMKRMIECDTALKNVHFSIDDVIYAFYDLTTNTPESIWDNDFFAQLKELHETHGICITCNCFIYLASINFRLSSTPNTWAEELQAAKGWLRFAFHGSDNKVYSTNDITNDYEEFVTDIYAITGDYECIDTVTRTQSFTRTLENCNAMKDIEYGITTFLTADDTRNSYYLNAEQSAKAYRRGKYIDTVNNNMFIKSLPRLDTNGLTAIQAELSSHPGTTKYVEIYAHEPTDASALSSSVFNNIIKPVCAWFMNEMNYESRFLMDIFD